MAAPQRLALRQQLAEPALAELHAWLLASQRIIAAGSGTAKAIRIRQSRASGSSVRIINSNSLKVTIFAFIARPQESIFAGG